MGDRACWGIAYGRSKATAKALTEHGLRSLTVSRIEGKSSRPNSNVCSICSQADIEVRFLTISTAFKTEGSLGSSLFVVLAVTLYAPSAWKTGSDFPSPGTQQGRPNPGFQEEP